MAQYALPDADGFRTGWSEGAGDGDGAHFDEMDEGFGAGRGSGSGPDGATSYWTNDGSLELQIVCAIAEFTDPGANSVSVIRFEWRKDSSGGRQVDMTGTIHDPSTARATAIETNVGATFVTAAHTLSSAEEASLDYVSQNLRVEGAEVGGGGPRDPECSAMEFEGPDVAADRSASRPMIINRAVQRAAIW